MAWVDPLEISGIFHKNPLFFLPCLKERKTLFILNYHPSSRKVLGKFDNSSPSDQQMKGPVNPKLSDTMI